MALVVADYGHILSRFRWAYQQRDGRLRGWCPVGSGHRRPNLVAWTGRDGQLLVGCWAGCPKVEILRSVGLTMSDLFPETYGSQQLAARPMRQIVATYDYRDERGQLLYQVVRYSPKSFAQRRPHPDYPDRPDAWMWDLNGVETVLYRLPELIASRGNDPTRNPVVIVEGEKDAETLRELGLVATCNSGGAGKWQERYGADLRGRRVAVIPDNDAAGLAHACTVLGSLVSWGAAEIRLVRLSAPDGGDVTDWLRHSLPCISAEQKKRSLLAEIRRAPVWRRLSSAS